jgi:hypothetical protein
VSIKAANPKLFPERSKNGKIGVGTRHWLRHCQKGHNLRSGITGSTMSHLYGLIDFVGAHPQFVFVTVLLLALSEAPSLSLGLWCPVPP